MVFFQRNKFLCYLLIYAVASKQITWRVASKEQESFLLNSEEVFKAYKMLTKIWVLMELLKLLVKVFSMS